MRDDLDDRLSDAVALDEINLYANVLTAVAAADRPLTDDELDAVLGLDDAAGAAPANLGRRRLDAWPCEHNVGTPMREAE